MEQHRCGDENDPTVLFDPMQDFFKRGQSSTSKLTVTSVSILVNPGQRVCPRLSCFLGLRGLWTAGFSVLKLRQSQANLDNLIMLGYCMIDVKYMLFLKIKIRIGFF